VVHGTQVRRFSVRLNTTRYRLQE